MLVEEINPAPFLWGIDPAERCGIKYAFLQTFGGENKPEVGLEDDEDEDDEDEDEEEDDEEDEEEDEDNGDENLES